MDLYLTSLALGGVGLVAMAFSGFGRHGQGHGHNGGHGHAGSGHTTSGHSSAGHAATHGVAHHTGHTGIAGHTPASSGHSHATAHGNQSAGSHGATHTLMSLMSPRVLFSLCLGLGTTGILLRPLLAGPVLLAAAVAGGILFERLIVTPIWNFTFRFASNPALTLESALMGDATAVTKFDANGQGIIALEVDGQMVQLLGTLQSDDRALGAKVLAGARLRVAEVDAARNRCTVSLY